MNRNSRQDLRASRAGAGRIARVLRMLPFACIALGVDLTACGNPLPQPSSNYNTNYRLVFPVVATGPTSIDGLASDPAWSSGFIFGMEDGGSFPAAKLRGVADANAIYLYAEVEDSGFEDTDVMVIGFNPDNTPGNYRRLHIFPCKPTGICPANGSNINAQVDYSTGSYGPSYTWTSASAASIVAKSATATAGSVVKWSVEVKIPRGAPFNFVDTNFFGFFVAVARTDPSAGLAGTATQYTWIPGQIVGGATEDDILTGLETGTPAPSTWGNATLSPKFGNGVTITGSEIYSSNANTGQIEINGANTFYAKAANYLAAPGDSLTTAHDVVARFKIANFGLASSASWADVPVAGNPTAAANIAPTSVYTFATQPWSLTAQQKTDYQANTHQCIRVDLSSTNPATTFVNNTAQRNMDFVETFSPFKRSASVNTKGWETREATTNITLRESFANFDPALTWRTDMTGATKLVERTYEARVNRGATQPLDITIDPPAVQFKEDSIRMAPGTGGRERPAMSLAVEPNEVLTIIADGTIQIGGQPVSAVGMSPRGEGQRGVRRPGELIGSFDQFKTVVHLGGASSIKVPADGRRLDLKIDADSAQYAKQGGEGYRIQVVRSRAEPWMIVANPELARPTRGADVHVTLGANLPTWQLRGERDTGRFLRIGKQTFRVHEPIGTFGYMVRRIGNHTQTPKR